MTKDLTTGNPLKLLISFSIPLLMGNILQQLYNLMDTVIVGRYLGITALSAVGATSSMTFLILGFCTGLCTGFSIPVACYFGAGDYGRMRRVVRTCIILSAIFAVTITALTVYFCRDILIFMKTPEEILEGSCGYLQVIFAGIAVTFYSGA